MLHDYWESRLLFSKPLVGNLVQHLARLPTAWWLAAEPQDEHFHGLNSVACCTSLFAHTLVIKVTPPYPTDFLYKTHFYLLAYCHANTPWPHICLHSSSQTDDGGEHYLWVQLGSLMGIVSYWLLCRLILICSSECERGRIMPSLTSGERQKKVSHQKLHQDSTSLSPQYVINPMPQPPGKTCFKISTMARHWYILWWALSACGMPFYKDDQKQGEI